MTPTHFRQGAPDTTLRYAVSACSLGSVLVAASEKGVCAILFGDEPGPLVEDLQTHFPKATLVAGDRSFGGWVAKVVRFVETPQVGLDLPLDIRGTVFQRRVGGLSGYRWGAERKRVLLEREATARPAV